MQSLRNIGCSSFTFAKVLRLLLCILFVFFVNECMCVHFISIASIRKYDFIIKPTDLHCVYRIIIHKNICNRIGIKTNLFFDHSGIVFVCLCISQQLLSIPFFFWCVNVFVVVARVFAFFFSICEWPFWLLQPMWLLLLTTTLEHFARLQFIGSGWMVGWQYAICSVHSQFNRFLPIFLLLNQLTSNTHTHTPAHTQKLLYANEAQIKRNNN